ncbi:ferrochelatase [Reichenbachiella versicolor]|uniref:ferrochelatase n=1 Tax=Reichenbachiella versicolor TaxID=1821036 RepID=UPI000D6E75B3|nr:ferrochelatase [Reichenbachiella versicolor]
MSKKGILLVNLGTPDDPSTPSVRRYLKEFLMDGRVIDIPFIPRWFLVNVIIATFRAPKSAAEYQKLWEDRGSPLKFHSEDLVKEVQMSLGDDYHVVLGMRYQNPTMESALEELKKADVTSIKVIPLFPQYASATTGSVHEKVMDLVKSWQTIPKIEMISQFFNHPLLLDTIVDRAQKWMSNTDYDHFLFSYHGLPERQIKKANASCQLADCCSKCEGQNLYCYRAQCFETTRLLCDKLNIPEDKVSTTFQSRLGKDPWVQPYTEDTLQELAKSGIKKVLAFSPAFVADCLETTLEVGETYQEEFIEAGGEQWDLVESLNIHPKWIECVVDLAK